MLAGLVHLVCSRALRSRKTLSLKAGCYGSGGGDSAAQAFDDESPRAMRFLCYQRRWPLLAWYRFVCALFVAIAGVASEVLANGTRACHFAQSVSTHVCLFHLGKRRTRSNVPNLLGSALLESAAAAPSLETVDRLPETVRTILGISLLMSPRRSCSLSS